MSKRTVKFIAFIIIGIVLVAGATVGVLSFVTDRGVPDNSNSEVTAPVEGESKSVELEKAESVESEAKESVNSNPSNAVELYKEAKRLYEEAGETDKANQAQVNAETVIPDVPDNDQPKEEAPGASTGSN